MPAVDKPPIQLSVVEMDAIIAYLQSKDGNEVTVALPSEAPTVVETPAAVAGGAPVPANTPEEAIGKYGCQACHTMLGSEAALGPALNDTGARLTKQQIVEAILEPDAVIAEGFPGGIMPKDFDTKMTVKELEMIVEFLATQK